MTETALCPIQYSDKIGSEQLSLNKSNQEELGQFFTPHEVAAYMASMLHLPDQREIQILDPGAGSGVLASSAIKALVNNFKNTKNKKFFVTLYEVDKNLIRTLTDSMNFLKDWCHTHGASLEFTIKNEDYILSNSDALDDEPTLFERKKFDIVISNPPYFKISKDDKRAIACSVLVHGQPNIYALFMGVAAAQLNENGQFLFITPRSFTSGQYFKSFRNNFFRKIQLKSIHAFESRTEAFDRDSVLQENIICYGIRSTENKSKVEIFSSSGKADLNNSKKITVPLLSILDTKNNNTLALPLNNSDHQLLERINGWKNSLDKMGLKISTGPVVPFRSRELIKKEMGKKTIPLLWIQHVIAMKIKFPIYSFRKEQWIVNNDDSKKLLVKNQNMILMRRFSPKEDFRRLTLAPYEQGQFEDKYIGLENHLNYIYEPSGRFDLKLLYGLSAYLSSKIFDSFFRITNGNTQVSATELRNATLPSDKELKEIGALVIKSKSKTFIELDAIVDEILEVEIKE